MESSPADRLKRDAGYRAAEWVLPGMRLGLGTGSTVRFVLEAIAERMQRGELSDVVGVPTSEATATRARTLGIPLTTLDESPLLDLTIDGADEVDPELDLIKGLGAALLREKMVAGASRRLVIVADEGKLVRRLGTQAPLPVEVEPFGMSTQLPFLRSLGCEPVLRTAPDGTPVVTDGGGYLLDCRFPDGIEDPRSVEATLDGRVGVRENGLFLGMAEAVVVAGERGVRVLERKQR